MSLVAASSTIYTVTTLQRIFSLSTTIELQAVLEIDYYFSLLSELDKKKKKRGVKVPFCLPWSTRYKIALGIADAIAYLHNGTEQCVVHRDIKPSNILLSSNKKPKVKRLNHSLWSLISVLFNHNFHIYFSCVILGWRLGQLHLRFLSCVRP